MELRSARTTIRRWRSGDDARADLWPPYNDPLDSLWNLPRSFSSTADLWGESYDSFSRESWAVEDRYGRLIGRISLREIDARRQQARLGVTFGAPYVGQGLGTEALATFLDYYFNELGFQRMVLDVAAPNQRAVRCYERLGFRYVASDWRRASGSFDRRVLDSPPYRGLARFFDLRKRQVEVEFFEMCLDREHWHPHAGKALAARR